MNKQPDTNGINKQIEILEQAIKICNGYFEDKYNLYKGRAPYKGNEEGRADNYVEGNLLVLNIVLIFLKNCWKH